jgi:2-polyprenyl-6-methoxyphenol hydroxylase-like FAD-dependent oxidoreductase
MACVKTALIIGGGIAGPATALALHKAGMRPTIYEAYPSPAEGIGGVLALAPNGMNALRIIGLDQEVERIGQPMRGTIIANGRGKQLMAFSGIADLPASQVVWRAELCRVLHDAIVAEGIRTEFGKRLAGIDDASDGITAHFSDGSTATTDVLVGADGIHSTVRTLIDPNAPRPKYDGLLGFGASADIDVPGQPDAMYFVFGKRAFLGYWRQPEGRTAWFSNLPHAQPISAAQAREVPAADWLRQLREIYEDDVPARDLLRHTSAGELFVLGALDMLPPVTHWHHGRMVLVGDSAHAPNHSSGQGASLAIESAIELARCLRDLPDVPAAFSAYEGLRRPRVTRIAAEAAKTNNRKAAGPLTSALMSLAMPLAAKTFMKPEKMFGWVQGYRINWDEAVTIEHGQPTAPGGLNAQKAGQMAIRRH